MPQEIRVLKCYGCQMHQADIVKKAKKWQCKICGQKQIYSKEIFRGSGPECRQLTQQLNFQKSQTENEGANEIFDLLADDGFYIKAVEDLERGHNKDKEVNAKLAASRKSTTYDQSYSKENSLNSQDENRLHGTDASSLPSFRGQKCLKRKSETQNINTKVSSDKIPTSKWKRFL